MKSSTGKSRLRQLLSLEDDDWTEYRDDERSQPSTLRSDHVIPRPTTPSFPESTLEPRRFDTSRRANVMANLPAEKGMNSMAKYGSLIRLTF